MIYMGHQESVHSIVWSPNGKMIASASDDHTVQIWDAGTGATVFSYAGHSDQVRTVAWSPDGRFIASGSVDQTVRIWAASSGHDLVVYYPHNAEVDTISWAPGPDSRYIVSGSKDEGAPNNSSIQAWDYTTSCRAFNISGYDRALSVAWSPDGMLIASGHGDEYARVWDRSGKQFFVYHGHTNWVYAVAWSPDSRWVASASADQTVRVWQVG